MKLFRMMALISVIMVSTIRVQAANDSGLPMLSKADNEIFERYIEWIKPQRKEPINRLVLRTAMFFEEKPYVANTLESTGEERLSVSLQEFDCTTLVETCLALAITVKSNDLTVTNFLENLRSIRYRKGKISGYPSRLHYVVDWIHENEKREVVENITPYSGGEYIKKDINFMTSNSKKYQQLKGNSKNIAAMKDVEAKISNGLLNQDVKYSVIPTDRIPDYEWSIQDGDIIFFATHAKGLDYSHAGIAMKTMKRPGFYHASTQKKSVVKEAKSIYGYCFRNRNILGITVVRIKADSKN